MGLQCRTMQASVFSGVWRVSKGQVRTVSGSSQACFPWVGGDHVSRNIFRSVVDLIPSG